MKDSKLTIGIYGTQDVTNSPTPTISHDHAIAVMKNGQVIRAIELERFDRKKHSDQMPIHLYKLLKDQKLLSQKANFIFVDNILGKSFINREGNIRFEAPLETTLYPHPVKGRLWFLDHITDAYLVSHELAHIASTLPFFGAFKENSLLIHYDGGASLSNFSAWIYKNGVLKNFSYHWNLKKMTSLFNANALIFNIIGAKATEQNSVPGKLMGFASYGSYSPKIEKWLEANDYFENLWSQKEPFFKSLRAEFDERLNSFDQKNKVIQNIAATIQHVFIRNSLIEIELLQKETKTEYLYYSGGSALNIVLNAALENSKLFKKIFIPPCCNDSGLALGAAAFFEWHQKHVIHIHSPYLNNWDTNNPMVVYSEETIEKVAQFILTNKVIGICNGPAECGPRALGNRSLICLASSTELAKKVSMELKQREWYRPVAPIMLAKNALYFTGLKSISELSRFMLMDFKILPENMSEIKGVVHIDGTARIQVIFERNENPFIFDLLTYLDKNFSVRALINTSFNQKGEPMVHTTEDALKSAQLMKLDALVLNGKFEILTF